jgi:hypothetical protein
MMSKKPIRTSDMDSYYQDESPRAGVFSSTFKSKPYSSFKDSSRLQQQQQLRMQKSQQQHHNIPYTDPLEALDPLDDDELISSAMGNNALNAATPHRSNTGGAVSPTNLSADEAAGAGRKKARALYSTKDEEEILQILTEDLCSSEKGGIPEALERLNDFCDVGVDDRTLSNSKYIVETDGVGLILQVMKMNPKDVDILASGAEVLQNLMYAFDDACDKVHRLGGAQTVIKAMKAHPDNVGVQRSGCGFICNFIWDDKDRKRLVVKLTGIQTILTAMKKHTSNKGLQQFGSRALSIFCEEKEYVGFVAKGKFRIGASWILRNTIVILDRKVSRASCVFFSFTFLACITRRWTWSCSKCSGEPRRRSRNEKIHQRSVQCLE